METLLKNIADLTNSNNHTTARLCIAKFYPYLEKYKKIFEHIRDMQEIEGCIPHLLSEYTKNITLQMFHEIEKHEGF